MTKSKVTAAGLKTLKTIAANGGEMNGWAGQAGFHAHSADKLVRDGFLDRVPNCEGCGESYYLTKTDCARPLSGQKNGNVCYIRVRITETGRAAIA